MSVGSTELGGRRALDRAVQEWRRRLAGAGAGTRAGRWLWLRLATGAAGAAALLVLRVPSPQPVLPLPASIAGGVAVGFALFVAVERRLPGRPHPELLGARVWAAKHAVLGGWAAVEEIVWRGLVLAELAPVVGAPTALAASSVCFGLWHRSARRLHVLTGLVFGSVYLTAASLPAAWAAHAGYNAAVAVSIENRRAPAEP